MVGLPDERWGETLYAFVVLAPDATAGADASRQFTRDRLAHVKAPKSVQFVDELPKTATGKIRKYVLRGGRTAITVQ